MHLTTILSGLAAISGSLAARGPFFETIDNETHIIGNDIWNITIGMTFGTKLYYKGKDIVGEAVGHYVSYSKHVL